MNTKIANRIKALRNYMAENNYDAVIISKEVNVRYFSDFTGDSTWLIISHNAAYLLTDSRYTQQALQQIPEEIYSVVQQTQGMVVCAAEIIGSSENKHIAVEGNGLFASVYIHISELLTNLNCKVKVLDLDSLRIIKDKEELDLLRKAVWIADEGFKHILNYVKIGMSENQVAQELENFMRSLGSERPAFTTIVASGQRGALPHGVASDKLINYGEFVTIDFGAVYQGYHSDITRTFAMGKVSDKLKDIYHVVLNAQLTGLEHIGPEKVCKDVDKVVRDFIANAGYGDYFGHGLGHGVGLEIHELPRLSPTCNTILKPNMVVTDEPGIYIPDLGGVRIEDTVLVTADGCQPLTQSEKKLIEI